MLRRSARSSTVLLVLLLAVPAPAKRARYYEDEGAAPQRPLGPALGPALGPTYRRRDLADVWESYEDGPRPAALSMRREYRPYGTYWTLADDAPRPASAPRYPEEGYYIRRRFAAAAPRKADDGYPGEPYGGRYAVRWVPVRVDADQDLHQDDADDAPPWPERRKEPPRHLADLPVDDLPRRGRRPVELTATEQPRPSRRPPPDATTEDTTAKPLNVHLWVSVDEKTPLLVPSVLQASQPPVPPPSPPPTLPPSPPQQSPQRSVGRKQVVGSKLPAIEGRSADDMNPGKHIVINNYYQNHAPAVHDAGLHAATGDDAAATTEPPASDDDQPPQQGGPEQSGDVPPPAEATAPAVHMDLTSVATTTRPSTTTAGNAADALEPLAASDLETYLGSDLHDVDDAKPSAHSGHRTASPVHLVPHAHQHPKKKVGGRGGGSAQGGAQGGAAPGRLSSGHAAPAAPAGFSGKKRCFSIVLEDKVKRYKETPC